MNEYLSQVFSLLQTHGYILLFLGVMLESVFLIGIIFPGVFIMIAAGYFSGTGELNIYYALLTAFVGMFVGDNISFLLGKYKIIKLDRIKSLLGEKINIDRLINNTNASLFILFYHFPAYARMVIPTILGNLGYSVKKWMILNTLGTMMFTITFVLIGFFFGFQSKGIQGAISLSKHLQLVFLVLVTIFLISGLFSLLKVLRKKQSN